MTENLIKVLKATHSGDLKIGDIILPCAVLDDGTRVLSRPGFLKTIGRTGSAAIRRIDNNFELPVFLTADNLKPFIDSDLILNSSPIKFRPLRGRGDSIGYKAEILPHVCSVFLEAAEAGVLRPRQQHIYQRCKILIRGFAVVGITALVDEATGYQEIRDKMALQAILDQFLRKELAAWAKRFPDEFYQEMFRLRGWQWKGMRVNRPSIVGHYTNDLVYERLAPGLLNELEDRNPRDEKGNRRGKHHQWLTDDVGHPALAQHLYAVISFMRASSSWEQFYRMVQRAFPKRNTTLLLPMPDVDNEAPT